MQQIDLPETVFSVDAFLIKCQENSFSSYFFQEDEAIHNFYVHELF